ncbi:LytR family transcriptional regulator [Micromonospora sp. KC207]|uniref:LCP family protein n=1 Tax=Micromonospora carbonacea TaxID=47853 RepID=A0A7D5YEV7_9ACTN|nr:MULTISPECIES: LCP family protein [unclassified Micromonospora]EEP72455.1 transcription attenuator lytR [Micromonospora sp. ATCC 39149]QLJ98595.1 LCP family protein [Micromonospora carbonacea]TDC58510.1 LytR family transcriptional regulator [Micromonospora sp. KC207]
MSATASAGVPLPYLRRSAGRAPVPGPGQSGSGRARVPGAQWYPAHDDRPPGRGFGGSDGPSGPGGPGGPGAPRRAGGRGPRPRWGRIGLVAGVAVLVLALLGGAGAWFYTRNLNQDLARTDPFSELTGGRPAKAVEGALNILLVGSDSRDPDAPVDQQSQWRADTIIVMHIPADHKSAYLVSIPRDLYVPIPQNAQADCGSGQRAKINAAFAFGGLPLAVKTVECFTDVRIDNVMAIDFAGFKQVTDALGGVDLKVERSITSIHKPFRKFTKGTMHMNGTEALDWIRQRKQFPDGDFARMRHQQEFLKALMDKAASTGTLTNPKKLNAFLQSVTDAVTVDQSFSLVDMALQFRSLRGENLIFVTSPNSGSDTINGESVVVSDREKALAMYQAMSADTMAAWVKANPPAGTSG